MSHPGLPASAQATDPASLSRLFGDCGDLLPLWIAEPYLDLAPEIVEVLRARSGAGWYGYEVRPADVQETFWDWMARRHGWDGAGLHTLVSPSVGTSIGALLELVTDPGDGVILQPPVFTDFKPLVQAAGRTVVRNPLAHTPDGYRMGLDDLAARAAEPKNRALILCNPHNPVGRVWTRDELARVATICEEHDVFVIADEIHADLALPPHVFTPFATTQAGGAWAALHGPIKTFGLAGVCDTLLIAADDSITDRFAAMSSRLHLTRNNVFGIAALRAAYGTDGTWLDGLLDMVASNVALLEAQLPDHVAVVRPDGTYLAWLDFRRLGLEVPELAAWLTGEARLALSPGHWFGREGAGYARMTMAAPPATIDDAAQRLRTATERR